MGTEQLCGTAVRRHPRATSALQLPHPRPGSSLEDLVLPHAVDSGVQIRRAGSHDHFVLRTISIEGRAPEFVGLPPELASTLLSLQYVASAQHRRRYWPTAVEHVIDHHHVPAGLVTTRVTAAEVRVVDIGLLPGFRNQGIGASVIRAIADRAGQLGMPLRFRAPTFVMMSSLVERIGARVIGATSTDVELEATLPDDPAVLDTSEPVIPQGVAEWFLGEIRQWAHGPTPEGWQCCDGSELAISDHPDLFELLGNVFGGDGSQTFCLPSLSGTHSPDGAFMVAMRSSMPVGT